MPRLHRPPCTDRHGRVRCLRPRPGAALPPRVHERAADGGATALSAALRPRVRQQALGRHGGCTRRHAGRCGADACSADERPIARTGARPDHLVRPRRRTSSQRASQTRTAQRWGRHRPLSWSARTRSCRPACRSPSRRRRSFARRFL